MGKGIKLSIGMIVKNEEKNLGKCLAALRPLQNRVESELIIADTGSTDKTREIASEYTSQLYTFPWCNDFSKARNFVLEKASGEWFMYIDADEWLEQAEPLIEFLNSQESAKYNDIWVILKNYYTYDQSGYEEDYIKRVFRRLPGRNFKGTIHEGVPEIGPVKYLDVYLHHYGYVQEEKIFGESKKTSRNTP